jgi:hypothetical protein
MSCENCNVINLITKEIVNEQHRNSEDFGISVSGNPMVHISNFRDQFCTGCENTPTVQDILGNNHPESIQYSG